MSEISQDEFQKYWTLLSEEEKKRLAKSFMGHFISVPSDQSLPSKIWNELVLKWNPEINKDWLIKNWRYKNQIFYDQAVKEIENCKTFSAFYKKRKIDPRSDRTVDWYKSIVSYDGREITGYGASENEALIQAKNHAVRFVEQELFDKNNIDYSER